MEINVPLFRKTVVWVEEQAQLAVKDRRWYQPVYVQMNILAAQEDLNDPLCGTAMCFAGKLAIDAGWKPVLISVDSANGIVEADTAEKDGVTRDIDNRSIVVLQDLGLVGRAQGNPNFGCKSVCHVKERANHDLVSCVLSNWSGHIILSLDYDSGVGPVVK